LNLEYRGEDTSLAAASENPAGGTAARLLLAVLVVALFCGCTTHSYKRDDGALITVKKFVGVPYLEKEQWSTTRTPGSEYRPVH